MMGGMAPVSGKEASFKQKPKLWQQQSSSSAAQGSGSAVANGQQDGDDTDSMSVAESVASSTPKGPGFLSRLSSSKQLGSGFSTPGKEEMRQPMSHVL